MKDLVKELNTCDSHYIRCIKPNEVKKFKYFIPKFSLEQIQYLGVLDSIKVRKSGYPIRRSYLKFYSRYEDLSTTGSLKCVKDHQKENSDFRALSQDCIDESYSQSSTKKIIFGKTFVFMKIDCA